MTSVIVNEVRKGFYLDSVALMRYSRTIAGLDGIEEAALMMGTPANRQIMTDAGLLDEAGKAAEGGDLVIGIRAKDRASADNALTESRALLDQPAAAGGEGSQWRPRSLRAALKTAPNANLALISVPGDFAIAEARKAIRRGLHTMIFSDNVDLAAEAELKREAKKLGRLVMGPDCGTAIINSVPLAFANVVPRGGVGIIGASGTGTQEISCLVAWHGGGISHAIGVGGRDLKPEVGAISTLMAIDALDDDPQTKHLVLVSKPPEEAIAAKVLERVAKSPKPATICFIGAPQLDMPANATQVHTLKAAALNALGITEEGSGDGLDSSVRAEQGRTRVEGLFSGGTLCAETQVVFRDAGQAVVSNAAIPGVPSLDTSSDGHRMIDLGDDEYTRGKPHPMIDPSVRDDALKEAFAARDIGVILVDVVIGHGAHQDPAAHLSELVKEHGYGGGPLVIASVTGTEEDPQGRSAQVAKLKAAGIHVAPTNADAARWALAAVQTG